PDHLDPEARGRSPKPPVPVESQPEDEPRPRSRIKSTSETAYHTASIDPESWPEIASRQSSDSDSEFVSRVTPTVSPPRALRRRSRARSSCILQRARSASVLNP